MPHIVLLDNWKARINQLHGLAEMLFEYSGEEPKEAEALLETIETSVSGDLNASTIDGVISDVETFLGI